MPLGLHWYELLIILGVVVLVFGAKRLPELGSSVGKTIKEFKKSLSEDSNSPAAQLPPPATTAERSSSDQ
ncbi:MAG: Twin-arginine translocation protein TatA [Ktedonobacterales bacterium]|jgi:sec-independent protein translocase protein TatA|nr:MAG: Twin-arginine translocation protein TatA [Ktedonobacterales bacterium]